MNMILFCKISVIHLSYICGSYGAVYLLHTYLPVIINRSKMLSGLTLIMLAFASSSANPVSLATGDGLIGFSAAALKQVLYAI